MCVVKKTYAKNYESEGEKSFVFLQKHKNKMLFGEWQRFNNAGWRQLISKVGWRHLISGHD